MQVSLVLEDENVMVVDSFPALYRANVIAELFVFVGLSDPDFEGRVV
jgi:hypothetical protein